ncbi:hypothetical protein KIPB_004422, partial [Kipferlia bialata]|eukprot:g4422.t1
MEMEEDGPPLQREPLQAFQSTQPVKAVRGSTATHRVAEVAPPQEKKSPHIASQRPAQRSPQRSPVHMPASDLSMENEALMQLIAQAGTPTVIPPDTAGIESESRALQRQIQDAQTHAEAELNRIVESGVTEVFDQRQRTDAARRETESLRREHQAGQSQAVILSSDLLRRSNQSRRSLASAEGANEDNKEALLQEMQRLQEKHADLCTGISSLEHRRRAGGQAVHSSNRKRS